MKVRLQDDGTLGNAPHLGREDLREPKMNKIVAIVIPLTLVAFWGGVAFLIYTLF
jgi:hypothetical protein